MTRRGPALVIRIGRSRSPLRPFVTVSLLVHVGATAALAILPGLHHRPAPMGDAWVVGLAAPPPSPGSHAGGASSAAPRPSPSPSAGVRLDAPKPADKTVEKKKKDKKERPEPKSTAPVPAAGPTPPAGPQLPGGNPGSSGTAGPGIGAAGGTGVFSMDAIDSQFAWYRASVVASLQSHWIRPVLEGVRGILSVTVTFDVDRDGTLRNIKVVDSSGVPSLDRSALGAVQDASPLPPLPSGWGQPPFAARFEFRFSPGNP
ncbi:MAG: TonB family protein [Acidobacteriia bacterium]|nr:TonB family protein [Terriglobia bacterium]